MLPAPGDYGVKQAAGHRILTHKTVQAGMWILNAIVDFECNSRVEKIPYNGKGTIVDGEKYGSMHGNSDRHLQEKLLPYRQCFFF